MTSYTQPRNTEAHEKLQILEHDLCELEGETLNWEQLRRDVHFNHQVGVADLAEWPRINEVTRHISEYRIRIAKLRRGFSAPQWPAESRKYVESFGDKIDVWDRLDDLDDQIEVFEDVYELANDRLSEFSYFQREFKLEILIAVLLVVEIVVMLAELYMLAK